MKITNQAVIAASLRPTLSRYLCIAGGNHFCSLCCKPALVRSFSCARLPRMPAEKRSAGTMAWLAGRFLPGTPATDVCKKWAAGTMAWFAGRFLPRIPARDVCKKWAAGTTAWFAGRFLSRIPATDVCKKWAAGTLTPFGVLKIQRKWGGVVEGRRHAASVSVVCRPPL